MTQAIPSEPSAAQAGKPSLVGMTRGEIGEALRALDLPERDIRMRAGQLWHWIYFRGASDFERMSSVAGPLRTRLADHYTLARPQVTNEQISSDGTKQTDRWRDLIIVVPSADQNNRSNND